MGERGPQNGESLPKKGEKSPKMGKTLPEKVEALPKETQKDGKSPKNGRNGPKTSLSPTLKKITLLFDVRNPKICQVGGRSEADAAETGPRRFVCIFGVKKRNFGAQPRITPCEW